MKPSVESQMLALLDGDLPAEEAEALEAVMLENEEAREAYLKLSLIHSALECRYSPMGQRNGVPVEAILADQRRQMIKRSAFAAAALILISALIMRLVMLPDPEVRIGSLKGSPDANWSLADGDGQAITESGKLVEGSKLVVQSGSVEATLESGLRMIADAPCELILVSDMEVQLTRGQAWFHAPKSAVGFAVETPLLKAVDLGTRFGVVAGKSGDQVHVMEGLVEVSALQAGKSTELQKGQAIEVSAAGLKAIELDAERFRTQLTRNQAIAIANYSFEDDVLPRDGKRSTKTSGTDDYNRSIVPSGWSAFDDGRGSDEVQGLMSTAPDSYFNTVLKATPDHDGNDQLYYSAGLDIYQVLGKPLQPNTTYQLSVDIGDRNKVGSGGDPGTPELHLGAGSEPGKLLLKPYKAVRPSPVDGDWVTWTLTFKTGEAPAGAGKPLRVELTTGRRVASFDRVRLQKMR